MEALDAEIAKGPRDSMLGGMNGNLRMAVIEISGEKWQPAPCPASIAQIKKHSKPIISFYLHMQKC
jgi:hypothetical protein